MIIEYCVGPTRTIYRTYVTQRGCGGAQKLLDAGGKVMVDGQTVTIRQVTENHARLCRKQLPYFSDFSAVRKLENGF